MKTAEQWFSEYGESHQNRFNKTIHYIFVPLILFSIVGLLASLPLGSLPTLFPPSIAPFIHLGSVLIIGGLIFYFRISFPIFVGMLLVSILVLWGNHLLANSVSTPLWIISAVIFVVSWIFQFIGHEREGKKPSFLKDIQFLMVGPAWILGHLYRKVGLKY